ncbi:hypothetical protein Taro_010349 [Colocasia esculenta]|uniref:GATA-type domain-containing protein n=1 Tax=Colocasia esculenta TaxID=4460 RepID=A0A843U309_COLES|nr:hypothetical protein [Colocasia esculenta]
MDPFEHSLCSDHLTPSEGSHSRFDLHVFLPVYELPSPFPCAIFSNPLQGEHHELDHPQAHEADEHFLSIGSTWQHSSRRPSNSPLPISKDDEDRKKKNTVTSRASVIPSSMKSGSPHWLSSKVKMVRKVMNPDRITRSGYSGEAMLQAQDQQQQSMADGGSINKNGQLSCSGGIIRVCSDCNTTKTPLWRSGPSGPKSLCNACGIRRRKARGAMAAAAGLIPAVGPSKLLRKEKMSDGDSTMPFKKRCKFTSAQTSKQLHFDDFALDLSKNPGLQRVFPQDEKEAAMLLMSLSCGLIRG